MFNTNESCRPRGLLTGSHQTTRLGSSREASRSSAISSRKEENSRLRKAGIISMCVPSPAGQSNLSFQLTFHSQVSYACPWAHRTLIVRKLKGLEDVIPYTSVHWHMEEKGWRFATSEDNDAPGAQVTADPIKGHEKFTHLRDIYFHVDPEYKGRFTVPTLFDVKQGKIVSNESSEIIRMFYSEVCSIFISVTAGMQGL
jgi:glutathionyl-hydroquinone reductase